MSQAKVVYRATGDEQIPLDPALREMILEIQGRLLAIVRNFKLGQVDAGLIQDAVDRLSVVIGEPGGEIPLPVETDTEVAR